MNTRTQMLQDAEDRRIAAEIERVRFPMTIRDLRSSDILYIVGEKRVVKRSSVETTPHAHLAVVVAAFMGQWVCWKLNLGDEARTGGVQKGEGYYLGHYHPGDEDGYRTAVSDYKKRCQEIGATP